MKKYKNVLINFIKIIYLIIVFVVSCIVATNLLSQGTADMTEEMTGASLPVMYLNMDGYNVNYLYGYTGQMECAYMRDTLTAIGDDRQVSYGIDTYGAKFDSLSFEVRSIDGNRLVENTDIYNYATSGDSVHGTITIKDLITKDEEYMLIFIMGMSDGRDVRYYTRLVWSNNVYAQEKVDFVEDFCRKTFDKDAATELTKYLESDASGDNSSYHLTNIHSSFKQVTWGDLNVERVGEPRVSICELTKATGYLKAEYQVRIEEESGWATCNVVEYYRIRYTSDRIYLLDWQRECDQILSENNTKYNGNQIELGIVGEEIELHESEGGNIFAFVDEGKLLSVNALEGRIARIFSFYDEELKDIRCSHQDYDIHILNVDETGNVTFMVYGYMNRGKHEGHVGISVYTYNSTTNTNEEIAYVDYNKSASMLRANISELSYVDRDGNIYFMLERNVYEINTDGNTLSITAGGLGDDAYKVSDSGRMLVWQNDGDTYSCTKLRLMNLSTGISEDVKAGYGEYIMPLGFMNEDLVFGVARSKDVRTDPGGTMVFPMYKLVIRGEGGEILKEYEQENVFIVDSEINDGLIHLQRVKYNDKLDIYEDISADQIMSTAKENGLNNEIKVVVTEALESIVQISMKESFADTGTIYLTPKDIIYEGSREIVIENTNLEECYYVYGLNGYMKNFIDAGNAVNYAYEISGLVVDSEGNFVWIKTTRASKNQIMAITEPDKTTAELSMADCIDTMLRFEGVTTNSRVLLSQGMSVQEILEEHLNGMRILNLTGCNLDAVLYYVNQDYPVLVVMNDSKAYLVTGFNDSQVVLYDPTNGELRKENMTDADNLFKVNGYRFITYVK